MIFQVRFVTAASAKTQLICLFIVTKVNAMLFRIIYVSQASAPLPLDLKDILASSRKNNHGVRVTGAMGFINGLYFQCLEGDKSVIEALFKKIETDPRHSAVKPLVAKPIFDRAFASWSMGLLTWNDETKTVFKKFNLSAPHDLYAADAEAIDSLVRSLTVTDNWMALA